MLPSTPTSSSRLRFPQRDKKPLWHNKVVGTYVGSTPLAQWSYSTSPFPLSLSLSIVTQTTSRRHWQQQQQQQQRWRRRWRRRQESPPCRRSDRPFRAFSPVGRRRRRRPFPRLARGQRAAPRRQGERAKQQQQQQPKKQGNRSQWGFGETSPRRPPDLDFCALWRRGRGEQGEPRRVSFLFPGLSFGELHVPPAFAFLEFLIHIQTCVFKASAPANSWFFCLFWFHLSCIVIVLFSGYLFR